MKVVCISDTHASHRQIKVPDGDILIHAGDITGRGELHVLNDFNDWLGTLPHKHKVFIAGNHDFCFEDERRALAIETVNNATYLENDFVEVEGYKIWGSPSQPEFCRWAFNHTEKEIDKWFSLADEDVDILVSHAPPKGVLDLTLDNMNVGSLSIWRHAQRINPKLHVFGHIHFSSGCVQNNEITFVNAAVLGEDYKVCNRPRVINLPKN